MTDGDGAGAPKPVVDLENEPASAADSRVVPTRHYTVRLHFAEPRNDVKRGDRVFDVALQGKTALADLDIVSAAGGPRRSFVTEFTAIPVAIELTITMVPRSAKLPVLSGLEVVAE